MSRHSEITFGGLVDPISEPGVTVTTTAAYTWDQIADYLTDGYWESNGGASAAFSLGANRTITYDISRLSNDAQLIAEHSMELWASVTGIRFQDVSTAIATYTESSTDYGNTTANAFTLARPNAIINGAITINGDRDYFKVALQAGVTYSISLAGFGSLDPILEIRNPSGVQVGFADDTCTAAGEYLGFTPTTSGTYFLIADGHGSTRGSYELSIQVAADLTFNDADSSGAYANSDITGNKIEHSYINISDDWDELNLNGYMLQTYIHEIGHALGLGHAGAYNGDAVWGRDNHYDNDSWSATIMSYFDQLDNPNDPNSYALLATMMPADIIAIQNLYGAGSAGFQTGDTIWGPGGNLSGDYFQSMLDMWGGLRPADPFIYDGADFAFTVYDTAGNDTLDFSRFGQNQSINLNQLARSNVAGLIGNVVIARGTVIENATGGSGQDTLTGNSANNFLRGLSGDDSLYGGSGNDRLQGGAGRDRLDGGAGRDTADYTDAIAAVTVDLASPTQNTGYAAGDSFVSIEDVGGSAYNDYLYGDALANILRGYNGDDRLYGRTGNDTLYGNNGNDILQGGVGADRLDGGAGRDGADYTDASSGLTASLSKPSSNTGIAAGDSYYSIENLYGSAYDDHLSGDATANLIRGHNGNDRIYGLAGNDTLYGNNGNDILQGGAGADLLDGGAGRDGADYTDASSGLTASLSKPSSNTGIAAGDSYFSIENLYGSAYDDLLTGDATSNLIRGHNGNDRLYGLARDDTLYGNNGDDILQGGAGADRLDGGAGRDGADYTDASAAVSANLTTPRGNTGIAAGDTYFSIENLYGSAYNDNLTGDAVNNLIRGHNGNDRLYGLSGDDTLYGGNGNDSLYGSIGNDTLSGGAGSDRLDGGAGADSFLFDFALGSTNVDQIVDFNPIDDRILLAREIFSALGTGALSSSAFTIGSSAATASTRIIYDQSTGQLYYDANGTASGVQVQFASLTAGTALTAADFLVV